MGKNWAWGWPIPPKSVISVYNKAMKRLSLNLYWPCFLLFLTAFVCVAAEHPVPLPGDNEIPGWEKEGSPRQFVAQTLFNHINGGAEIFNEFGFRELVVQTYRNNGRDIAVELYRMDDSPAALAMFYQQGGQSEGRPEDDLHIMKSPYQWTIQKGAWFIQLNAPAEARDMETALQAFGESISARIQPKACRIFDLLPQESRLPHSEFLVRGPYAMQPVFTLGEGDILQLEGRHYGVGALYLDSMGKRYTRLLVVYNDASLARKVFSHLEKNLDPYLQIVGKDETHIFFQDFKKEFGSISLEANQIELSFNLAQNPVPVQE